MKAFTETVVPFKDGAKEENTDAVIFATGQSFCLPFLEEAILKIHSDNQLFLYKYVDFPSTLEKPTLPLLASFNLWEPS